MSAHRRFLCMESLFDFGKHDGEIVEEVIENDPGYVGWLVKEDVVDFDDEVYEELSRRGIKH